jgi:flagellar biosynthetic protein FliR
MANEATYGLALGIIISILFNIVKTSGRIIERQMGLAMAEVMDPLTGDRTQPLGGLLEMIFILFLLSANVHHALLQIIFKSFQSYPLGTLPSIEVLTSCIVEAGRAVLTAGLRLSAPILAAFIVMLVVLAIMARVVPEMNILFLSMPVRVGLGMVMTMMILPYLEGFVNEFGKLMGKLLPL